MERRKTVLILGVSSFIGSNLANILSRKYKTIGTYFQNKILIKDVLTVPLDIENRKSLERLIANFRPDIIIYCIGENSLIRSYENQHRSDSLNSTGLMNLVGLSERYKSRVIYFSTSYVYSGGDAPYSEKDSTSPITLYGVQKATTEFYLQKNSLNYLILRVSNLFGRGYNNQCSFFETIERAIFFQEKLDVDDRIQNGFFDVNLLGSILIKFIDDDLHNRLVHISSKDSMSQFEFAKEYCRILGVASSFLRPKQMSIPIDKSKFYIAGDSSDFNFSLKLENTEKLIKAKIPTVREMLSEYKVKNISHHSQSSSSEIKYI